MSDPATNVVDSTINNVVDINTDLQGQIDDKSTAEELIAGQMESEILTWITKHIEDLQEALREVCDNEYSYHYTPPGFHVDQTAVDLKVF